MLTPPQSCFLTWSECLPLPGLFPHLPYGIMEKMIFISYAQLCPPAQAWMPGSHTQDIALAMWGQGQQLLPAHPLGTGREHSALQMVAMENTSMLVFLLH